MTTTTANAIPEQLKRAFKPGNQLRSRVKKLPGMIKMFVPAMLAVGGAIWLGFYVVPDWLARKDQKVAVAAVASVPVVPETKRVLEFGPGCTEREMVRGTECFRVVDPGRPGRDTFISMVQPPNRDEWVRWKTYRDAQLAQGKVVPEVAWIKYCAKERTHVTVYTRPRQGPQDHCN